MGKTRITIAACALAACCLHPGNAMAQYSAADSVYQHAKGNRLSVGGYGEIALTRNFYSLPQPRDLQERPQPWAV